MEHTRPTFLIVNPLKSRVCGSPFTEAVIVPVERISSAKTTVSEAEEGSNSAGLLRLSGINKLQVQLTLIILRYDKAKADFLRGCRPLCIDAGGRGPMFVRGVR